ncbi:MULTISPECIES: porin [Acidovorax]|uniref:porin n=1 Tax=Acidovorax TaxID=12916 RepID=UPI0002377C0F|nr:MULTISPECIES: porin [Acidovorax]KRD26829.1 porin [Acidovorax sp. Root267]KRD48559.1 porin [Acidovorax sp. Root275]MBD9392307.1 porin [Acidovorax sp. ACV01]
MKTINRCAVAALALVGTSAALAQSSVTLYGRINTTFEHQKEGNVSKTGLFNNSSRFGFKGQEDLGGGLMAGFQLESGFDSSSGASDSRGIFARQSEVNLAGGFGMVRLGNFTSESYYATADFISNHNHDTGSSSDALYAYPARDVNKIAYRTPSFGGATVEAGWAMHEQANGTGGKNSLDLAANYEIGKLGLGAGYSKLDDQNQFAVRASYSTGPFVVGAYVQRDKNVFIANGGNRTNVRLSGAYIMGVSEFHLNVGRAGKYSHVADSAATQYTVGYNYNLSKRTKIYTYYTRINNNHNASYGVATAGNDFSSFAMGVRHNF